MNTKQLSRSIRMLMELDVKLLEKKNHDYASDKDALSNFRDFGWKGVVVRLGDKYSRLKEMSKDKEPKNESVLDSLIDLCVYGYIARVLYMEGWDWGMWNPPCSDWMIQCDRCKGRAEVLHAQNDGSNLCEECIQTELVGKCGDCEENLATHYASGGIPVCYECYVKASTG